MAVKSAVRALQTELKDLGRFPVEGFVVKLFSEDNLFKWEVGIFGPPKTLYEGGYFRAVLTFPDDYPYNPPSMKFLSKMFHPNIYENGEVCISILHSPGEDPASGELPSERWNPTQSVRTILLSVISMLNEPNINSAAYVDASVSFRKWRDSNGRDGDYADIVKTLVKQSQAEAQRLGIRIPMTLEEYCNTGRLLGTVLAAAAAATGGPGRQLNGASDAAGSRGAANGGVRDKEHSPFVVTAVGTGMLDDDSFVEPSDPDDDDYFIEEEEDDEEEEETAERDNRDDRGYSMMKNGSMGTATASSTCPSDDTPASLSTR